MPCYDERDEPAFVRAEAQREWLHNSPPAELLCWVMSQLEVEGDKPYTRARSLCNKNQALARWWATHQIRDAKKAKRK